MGYINYNCEKFATITEENSKIVAYAFLVMDGSHWELVPQNLNHKDKILRALDDYQTRY